MVTKKDRVHQKRTAIRVTVAAAGLLTGSLAFAQFTSRGFVEAEYNAYPVFAANKQQTDKELAYKLQLEASYKANSALTFAARGFLRRDSYNDDRDVARFDELWVQYATPQWDIRVGNQLVVWGSVESISPIDIVNPRDYEEDLVEPLKIGTPAVRLRRRFENAELSFYWLPFFQPSRFTGPHSFYSISGGLPVIFPDSGRHDNQWAARYFKNADGFDFGVSFFNGLERNAIFGFNSTRDARVGRTYRAQRLALEVTKTVKDLLLKGEFSYRTTKQEGNRRALLYALGAEYTISSAWKHSDLTFFTEYLASSSNVRKLELTQNDLFGAIRWTLNDQYKQQLDVGFFWDLDQRQARVYRAEYIASPTENTVAGIRFTSTRDYFPGPRYAERKTGALHVFFRNNF